MTLELNGTTRLRCGITLFPGQSAAIEHLLADLAARCPTQRIMLVDQSGLPLSFHGDLSSIDLVALASLIAADISASQEIARRLGQYHAFQHVQREGQQAHTFISEAGPYLCLFAQVSREVPLGWARLLILHTARKLAEIAALPPEQQDHAPVGLSDLNLDDSNADALSDLFGDALDAIWNEDDDAH